MKPVTLIGWGALFVVVVVLGALAVTAVRNRSLPTGSPAPAELSPEERAYVAEACRVLNALGNRVWPGTAARPGWGDVPIPIVTYNERYVFLVGHPDPPAGWVRTPDLKQLGGPWAPVESLEVPGDAVPVPVYRAELPAALIDYERRREWVEGLAKYSELRQWEEAYRAVRAEPPAYAPVAAVREIRGFRDYAGYPGRYRNEVSQIRRTAGRHGDGRFYYSGMAQAYMLDRLAPDWQDAIFEDGVVLETLLAEAVGIEAP